MNDSTMVETIMVAADPVTGYMPRHAGPCALCENAHGTEPARDMITGEVLAGVFRCSAEQPCLRRQLSRWELETAALANA